MAQINMSRVGSSRQSRRSQSVKAILDAPLLRYEPATRAKTNSVLSIILGGGAGSRLFPLTMQRAKPAVPIGGAYRLIDVPMSNCINSGLSKIYILTQFNSTSLNRHLGKAYNMGSGMRSGGDGFVEVLAATQTPTDKEWFQGTADAVRQYTWLLDDVKNRAIEDVIILSGDHLYRMDYMKFVNYHRDSNADITIGSIAYGSERAKEFGLMKIDDKRRVTVAYDCPRLYDDLRSAAYLCLTPEEAADKPYIASMGIYVFKKEVLSRLLNETYPKANDFGGEIIPLGSFIEEATITNAVIGIRSIIHKGCTIQDAMVMGADYYESEEQKTAIRAAGGISVGVGAGSYITNAILDKNVRIGKNVKIINKDGVSEFTDEKRGIYIRSGIVVINKGTTIPDNTVI
ncbi:MAG: hypothetical protein WDW38_002096 [Sanguina aurantia]